ncbi:uncharacterized protein LOC118435535 [Folsomia candida]|uniref:F-box domain-containing protein n=1 Tax=Folsomia candida TaxID=158441 RepID=A0A226EBZ8_FOLCA|nr:uncharacterized protein LOC118435535 [Folsomia candida]OXA55152.1 hypothetical protein Fcan01_10500 [Folsomia candida]
MESQWQESAVEMALRNPIILTEILKRFPLKNCRLVCQFWNKMVVSLPNARLALNMKNGVNSTRFFEFFFKLDGQLAKRISTRCFIAPDDEEPTHWIDTFAYKLAHICDKFSDNVQILEITITYSACLQPIFQILKNCCPNLKQLEINYEANEDESDFSTEILPLPLPLKPKLTLLTVTSEAQVTPSFTRILQLVINASPNLREATLPWGFYPDLSNSKLLDSLTVEMNIVRPFKEVLAEFKPSELSNLLNQVGDQLVNLSFSCANNSGLPTMYEVDDWNDLNLTRFHFPRKMSKLQKFENNLLDVFQHQRLDIKRLPALKTLLIGNVSEESRGVDELLENIYQSKKVFVSVRNLAILAIQDPELLEGLKTAFPNLEKLELDTGCKIDFDGATGMMELDEVFNVCKGLEGLKHLNLALPQFSKPTLNVVQTLFDRADLYKRLKTLEIFIYMRIKVRGDLTEEEMELFKKLIVAMNAMDRVTIRNFYFSKESLRDLLDFMVSNKMSVDKFRMFQGGSVGISS